MDIKNELENELAMAILIEKRLKLQLDSKSGLNLIGAIKGALEKRQIVSTDDPLPSAATETACAG